MSLNSATKLEELRGLSQQVNYTDRATDVFRAVMEYEPREYTEGQTVNPNLATKKNTKKIASHVRNFAPVRKILLIQSTAQLHLYSLGWTVGNYWVNPSRSQELATEP
jgi:hypothetical protein